MKEIILKVFTILMTIFLVWIGYSYVDVIIHNDPTSENYLDYSKINLFVHLSD